MLELCGTETRRWEPMEPPADRWGPPEDEGRTIGLTSVVDRRIPEARSPPPRRPGQGHTDRGTDREKAADCAFGGAVGGNNRWQSRKARHLDRLLNRRCTVCAPRVVRGQGGNHATSITQGLS